MDSIAGTQHQSAIDHRTPVLVEHKGHVDGVFRWPVSIRSVQPDSGGQIVDLRHKAIEEYRSDDAAVLQLVHNYCSMEKAEVVEF